MKAAVTDAVVTSRSTATFSALKTFVDAHHHHHHHQFILETQNRTMSESIEKKQYRYF